MINGRKELLDVTLERKTFSLSLKNFARIYAQPLYSLMCSFIFSARIRIGNKGRFKNRVKETKNRVMDDPIADGSFMDVPQLWIVNIKIDILTVSIPFMDQFAMKLKEVISQMPLEKLDIGLAPFPSLKSSHASRRFSVETIFSNKFL